MPLQEGWDRCPKCGAKLDIFRISGTKYGLRCFSCGYRSNGECIEYDTLATDRISITADGNEEQEHRWFELTTASWKDPRLILQREIPKKAFNFKTSYGKYKKEEVDIIEVKSLEDLLEIMEEAGEDLVLGKTYHEENPCKYKITIYDHYLE